MLRIQPHLFFEIEGTVVGRRVGTQGVVRGVDAEVVGRGVDVEAVGRKVDAKAVGGGVGREGVGRRVKGGWRELLGGGRVTIIGRGLLLRGQLGSP